MSASLQSIMRIRFQILLLMLFTLFVVVPYFEINFLTDIVLSILLISALIVFIIYNRYLGIDRIAAR